MKINNITDLKEECVALNKKLGASGLVFGTFGNGSVYDPDLEVIAIKPSGVSYSDINIDNIVLINNKGKNLTPDLNPSMDVLTHLELHKEGGFGRYIVHTHSVHAVAASSEGRDIPILNTTMADYFSPLLGLQVVSPRFTEKSVKNWTKRVGVAIVKVMQFSQRAPGCLLKQHGVFAWGDSVEKAIENAQVIEFCCQVAMLQPHRRVVELGVAEYHYFRKINKYGQKRLDK